MPRIGRWACQPATVSWSDRDAAPLDHIQILLEAWQAARRKGRNHAAQSGQLSTQPIMHPELYFDPLSLFHPFTFSLACGVATDVEQSLSRAR